MNFLKWLCSFICIFCLYQSFFKHPFMSELPVLLLPEQGMEFFKLSSTENFQDEFVDSRPDCLQTSYNFSCYSTANVTEKKSILRLLEKDLLASLDHLTVQASFFKQFTFHMDRNIPWPHKQVRSYNIQEFSPPLGIPLNFYFSKAEAYQKVGKNLLPCIVHP